MSHIYEIIPYKHIHFIGIGGVHMSGIAELLQHKGFTVSGSDQRPSARTAKLAQLGIQIYEGHQNNNITTDTDLVVYTAAVPPTNPEFIEAKNRGITLMTRAALLGLIMKDYENPICIAGTHGKTTTTSLISEIFLHADKNPTILDGANLPSINGVLHDGGKEFFVVESCEYHDSFLQFSPKIGIILNVEMDHGDYFHSLEHYRQSFRKFAERIAPDGLLIINAEIPNITELTEFLSCNVVTFSLGASACCSDWRANNITYDEKGFSSFEVARKGDIMGEVKLNLPGTYNILNALAACAAAYHMAIPFTTIAEGLGQFQGVNRRFQFKGEKNGVKVFDDYAHHPTEIKAALAGARNMQFNRLWVVFQPHTHSRTQELLEDFGTSFENADKIIIMDIYSPAGREESDYTVHARDLVAKINATGKEAILIPTVHEVHAYLQSHCEKEDMLITMGAGDVFTLAEQFVSE